MSYVNRGIQSNGKYLLCTYIGSARVPNLLGTFGHIRPLAFSTILIVLTIFFGSPLYMANIMIIGLVFSRFASRQGNFMKWPKTVFEMIKRLNISRPATCQDKHYKTDLSVKTLNNKYFKIGFLD